MSARDREERTMRIAADASAFLAALGELSAELERHMQAAPDIVREFVEAFLRRVDLNAELARIDLEPDPASGAGDLVARVKPSNTLRDLLAALRARNFDLGILEQLDGHRHVPSAVAMPAGEAWQRLSGLSSGCESNSPRNEETDP